MIKPTVLIVEDDAILVIHLEDLLKRQNYTVLKSVATGEEAITAVKKYNPSIVIMDIELSGQINGIAAAEKIHAETNTPIVFLTGFSQDSLLQEAKIAAPYGYLVKPVPERELAATLEMALYKHKLDQQVKESESRFRTLVEQAIDGIFLADPNGYLIDINTAGCKMLGFSQTECLALNISEILIPEENEQKISKIKSLKTGEGFRSEQTILRKDGLRLPVEISGKKLENGYLQGIVRDITKRKEAEESIRLQSTALNAAANAIIITDINGRIEWVNPAFCNMTGYSKEEVIGRTPGAFVKSGYHDAAFYEKMWDTILKGNIWQGELINKRKDGVTSFEEMTITPLMNSEGVVTQFIAIKQDVSKRKRTEAALEKRVLALTQPMETAIKINFEDLFNLSDIQKLQDEFARATGVASIITYPDGTPITRPSNFCRLCEEIIRKTKKGAFNCYQSDAALGKFNSEGPSIQPCKSGGLWDAGAGITVGGQHIANWLIGQVRDQTQTEDAMRTYADEIGVDQEIFIDAFQEVPSMSSDQFSHIAQALYTLANQLSTTAFQNVQQARFIADRNRVEVQLKENNEKLQTIINTSLDGYFILTEDGSIQEVNNEYCKMTGYSRDELLQMTIVDLDAQENSQDALAHIQKVVEKGTDQFETQHRCKDGSLIDIEISTTYLKSKEYLLTFARNISERKRSEKQLIQLSERFAIATDSAGIGIWELDLISNTLVWDKWMYRLYGIQPEDFGNIYESWQTFIHPEDKDQTFEAVEQAIRGEKDYDLTFRIIQPDGNIRYLKAFAFVIRDKNNRPIRMTGVNYDVTDRKQAMLEKEIALTNLRERENLLSKIFEILPVGLWIADKNGNLIQSNIAGRKIWGAEPLVGMKEFGMFKARRLPSGEEIKPDDWALAQTIRDGKTITDEVLEIDAFDGVKRTILNYSAPVFDNEGKIENAVVVNLDISERKQIEKALLQSEEQYQLLFNEMAEGFALHEIICDDLGVPVDYRFLEVNPMFEKMTGLKKEKIIGKTVLEVKPNTESYWIQTYGQVALTGKEIRYENYSEEFGKWFDVIAFSPKPGQFATTFNDVTDQKLMEIEIRESEEKYRTYVNQAPFGVFVTDENGNYLQVNEAASKITGYTSAELLKMKIPDLLPEQIYEAAAEYFESVKNHGYDFGEFQFLIKNQEIRWFSVTGVKLSENRILSFVEDITDRKQADMKLQEQLDELTRWHSATLGRENRIMELKKEVNQLLKKHNLPVRYTSIEESLYE